MLTLNPTNRFSSRNGSCTQISNRGRLPTKLKDKGYNINAPIFHNIAKKERDGCTKFLTFVGRLSAVDLCC